MVAVIKTGTSIRRTFRYNEQKVEAGVAECLLAANYPKDVRDLTPHQRLQRLLRQAALNERVTRPSVHISLNFAPGEQLSVQKLLDIATTYMERIGFGGQPYLVYRHHDAGHPHLHLVSLKVRDDASRIDMHNIGRRQSEKARQEIEQAFGLKRAQDSGQRQAEGKQGLHPQLVVYGRSDTKRAIQRVLDAVLPHYRYTSLPELNAVLGLYRVRADRGSEGSRMHRHRGLTYRVLGEDAKPVGVPLKASAFRGSPTLAYLENRFSRNETLRLTGKARLKNRLDMALQRPSSSSLPQLAKALEKEGIHLILRQNTAGMVYGITYVDHHSRCVFNGSALGKGYSAKAVQERLASPLSSPGSQVPVHPAARLLPSPLPEEPSKGPSLPGPGTGVEAVLRPEETFAYVPHQLQGKRRKKKRRRIS